MGAYTATAKVWYPDTADTAKPDTLLSTQASSIENGLGARMNLQEKQIGMKAALATAMTFNSNGWATAPFSVTAGNGGQFITGMTVNASGVVTIQTPGVYFAATWITSASTTAGHTIKCQIVQNSAVQLTYNELPLSANSVVTTQSMTVLNCAAGDTVSINAGDGYATSGATTTTQTGGTNTGFVLTLIRPTAAS